MQKAALRYCSGVNTLDFSAQPGTSGSPSWSAKDEMKHYISSPIPPHASTDMIAWWTVRMSMIQVHSMMIRADHWLSNLALNLQTLSRFCPHPSDIHPCRARIFILSTNRHKQRNLIGPVLMEALQMLKFTFKKLVSISWRNSVQRPSASRRKLFCAF